MGISSVMSKDSWQSRVYRFSRLLLGGVFVAAGLLKIADPQEFSVVIDNYRLLPSQLSYLAAMQLPWLELVVGSLLVVDRYARAAALLGFTMSLSFIGAMATALYRGLDISCGCFAGDAKVNWWHLLFDLFLLLLAVSCLKFRPRSAVEGNPQTDNVDLGRCRKFLAASSALALLFNATYLLSHSSLSSPEASANILASGLRFEKSVLDLGAPTQGQVIQGAVKLINDGDAAVKIDHVEPSCGCTEAFLSSYEVPPHQSGTLLVGFDSGSKSGPSTEVVKVYIQGVATPLILEVKADVRPLFVFDPPLIQPSVGAPVRVTLRSLQQERAIGKTEFLIPTKEIGVAVIGQPEPGKLEFEVRLSEELPAPPAPAEVWVIGVATENEGLPPLSLYVMPEGAVP